MSTTNRKTDPLESLDLIVSDKYKICKHIGSGAFGVLYEGRDISNGQKVAIKAINKKKVQNISIDREVKIYRKYLNNNEKICGIPVLYWFGTDSTLGEIMVMDLLGPDLEKVFRFCNRKFSLKTTIMLAIQMLERLESLHNLHVIHRDLKPENFLLGVGPESKRVFLIDFGLSKPYIDRKTGLHIEFRSDAGMTGTARYCSVRTNTGWEQSRRDDLESLAYILSYFYIGSLPWQGLKVKNTQKTRAILYVKQSTSADKLFEGMPLIFEEYLLYCQKLEFQEKPDYQLWINRFRQTFDELDYEWDDKYDWTLDYQSLDNNWLSKNSS